MSPAVGALNDGIGKNQRGGFDRRKLQSTAFLAGVLKQTFGFNGKGRAPATLIIEVVHRDKSMRHGGLATLRKLVGDGYLFPSDSTHYHVTPKGHELLRAREQVEIQRKAKQHHGQAHPTSAQAAAEGAAP